MCANTCISTAHYQTLIYLWHNIHFYLIDELKCQYQKESERLQQTRDNYDHEVRLYAEVEITVRHLTI